MPEVAFLQELHTATKRDYMARMNAEKPENMRVAKRFDSDYWDGDRKFGYGGFKYDGRYRAIAEKIDQHYGLNKDDKVLDIGAGKGFLLHDLKRHAHVQATGIDISEYAVTNGMGALIKMPCTMLTFPDQYFDFTYSINVFHNLGYKDLKTAIREMVRVTKHGGSSYICVESYRSEEELCNLQCWALTCLSFYSPDDWRQIYEDCGYKGDYEFIYFE